MGPYTKAFYAYFLDINIRPNDRLNDAILRSQTFEQWKETNFGRMEDDIAPDEWVNRFLDQVHLTHYDIKEVLDGRELWDKDRGDLEDNPEENNEETPNRPLDRMADYSDLTLEELMQRMEEVKEQQKGEHSGGSHWIGTGGISPYGHGGAAKDGIRVGGSGGGKMARKVLGHDVTIQGNFDPSRLYAPIPKIEQWTKEMIDRFGKDRYIVNLGHGILPDVPVDHARAFINAVKNYS